MKDAAEQAGRDPDSVKVWSCFATVGDHIPEDKRLMKTRRPAGAPTSRATATCSCAPTAGTSACSSASSPTRSCRACAGLDIVGTTEQLEHVATLIPDEWLAPAATGSPSQCVAAIRNQFDLGCDAVIMHGATPAELAPIVKEYRSTG